MGPNPQKRADMCFRRGDLRRIWRDGFEAGEPGKPTDKPGGDIGGGGLPLQMNEPVGQRRGQVPAVGGHTGRVSGGNDPHMRGKPEVANGFFEHNPQHGGLHRGRGGGELVKKENAPALLGEAFGPVRRRKPGSGLAHHGQAGEVAGLMNGPNNDL